MTHTDRWVQLQMLTTLIVLLHKPLQKNLFRESSKTAFLAIKFLALRKWQQCPRTSCNDSPRHKSLWTAKFWMLNPEATRDSAAQ